MHKFEAKDKIYIDNGVLVRVVTASTDLKQKKTLTVHYESDVYSEDENGQYKCRYLYYSNFGAGYRVVYPGETDNLYRNYGGVDFVQQVEEMGECAKLYLSSGAITEQEKELIYSKYPDFKYVLNKWSGTREKIIEVLRIWKDHKEVELMLAAKMENLVFTAGFWKRTSKNQKALIDFLRKNPGAKKYKLSQLDEILKYNLTLKEYNKYYEEKRMHYYKISYDAWKYLKERGTLNHAAISVYSDYIKLLRYSTHNKKDPYWRYPKDLQEKHDKLLVEVGNLKDIEQRIKLTKKQSAYYMATKKYIDLRGEFDGYQIYIPTLVEDISAHARDLHQCLVSCDYISKVINHSCLLVFIKKDNKSIATCELLSGNRIGQFYANELDRKNCRPDETVKTAFNKWLQFKIEKEAQGV